MDKTIKISKNNNKMKQQKVRINKVQKLMNKFSNQKIIIIIAIKTIKLIKINNNHKLTSIVQKINNFKIILTQNNNQLILNINL